MTNLMSQSDQRPRMSKSGSVAVTSGAAISPKCDYFILNVTTATTISFTTLDGNVISLGTLPIGVFVFDIQATVVTAGTPANVVIAGFFNP